MDNAYPYDVKRRVEALIHSMETLVQKDPEQEIQGIALRTVDAVIASVREEKPDDPVVRETAELLSADAIAEAEPTRAADVLVVAEQLNAALGPYPPFFA